MILWNLRQLAVLRKRNLSIIAISYLYFFLAVSGGLAGSIEQI
jgi:hypothetical protein